MRPTETVAGSPPTEPSAGDPRARAIAADPRFAELRTRFRRFVFSMTAVFLAWYLLYVLLSAYARGFMAIKVFGSVNVALLLGLLQFVSTFAIAIVYASYSRRRLDPLAEELRAEGQVR
ncbi:DUF485 domain-containing protein [Solihabitans fulvus]|uniref:DUF485 domain-containing protein n=1 Tax=Solihabitans fulvus TaxID=1892852 RepID=UPI003F66764A